MTSLNALTAATALALAAAVPHAALAGGVEVFNEGFDNVSGLHGWVQVNHSAPPGNGWFQGNSGVFRSQAGASDSYIAANYLSAQSGAGTVDTWLITPVINLAGASTFSFFTRDAGTPGLADKLQVFFGAGAGTDPGGFTGLLASISGRYPTAWTQFSSDLDFTGAGRFAFHYVGDAAALDYIGIDSVRVVSAVPEPGAALMLGVGLGVHGLRRRRSHALKLGED